MWWRIGAVRRSIGSGRAQTPTPRPALSDAESHGLVAKSPRRTGDRLGGCHRDAGGTFRRSRRSTRRRQRAHGSASATLARGPVVPGV